MTAPRILNGLLEQLGEQIRVANPADPGTKTLREGYDHLLDHLRTKATADLEASIQNAGSYENWFSQRFGPKGAGLPEITKAPRAEQEAVYVKIANETRGTYDESLVKLLSVVQDNPADASRRLERSLLLAADARPLAADWGEKALDQRLATMREVVNRYNERNGTSFSVDLIPNSDLNRPYSGPRAESLRDKISFSSTFLREASYDQAVVMLTHELSHAQAWHNYDVDRRDGVVSRGENALTLLNKANYQPSESSIIRYYRQLEEGRRAFPAGDVGVYSNPDAAGISGLINDWFPLERWFPDGVPPIRRDASGTTPGQLEEGGNIRAGQFSKVLLDRPENLQSLPAARSAEDSSAPMSMRDLLRASDETLRAMSSTRRRELIGQLDVALRTSDTANPDLAVAYTRVLNTEIDARMAEQAGAPLQSLIRPYVSQGDSTAVWQARLRDMATSDPAGMLAVMARAGADPNAVFGYSDAQTLRAMVRAIPTDAAVANAELPLRRQLEQNLKADPLVSRATTEWATMTGSERLEAVQRVGDIAADVYGIQRPQVHVTPQDSGIAGVYTMTKDAARIFAGESPVIELMPLEDFPRGFAQAGNFVVHELTHAQQDRTGAALGRGLLDNASVDRSTAIAEAINNHNQIYIPICDPEGNAQQILERRAYERGDRVEGILRDLGATSAPLGTELDQNSSGPEAPGASARAALMMRSAADVSNAIETLDVTLR